jgi:hypothetical protein
MEVMPPSNFSSLGQPPATINWNGSPTTLAVQQRAVMAQTSNGSMILAFQNISEMNNAGKLSLTSGGSQPQFLAAPALALQPTVLINNWQANNLNLANISANTNTPIWIAAFGPCLGSPPQTLPTNGDAVPVALYTALKATTDPNWMQLGFQANSGGLCLFAIIGGPQDANGNNAYAIALNSQYGNTGPGTAKPAPPGYYATTSGNSYSYEFNWGSSLLFVYYFGSGSVLADVPKAGDAPPTVTLGSM